MSVRIQITNPEAASASAGAVLVAVIDAMGVVAKTWHDKFLPGHFTVAGGRKYNYQPRQGDDEPARLPNPRYNVNRPLGFTAPKYIENWHYSWRKRKTKRHNRPLVWSGRAEEMALAAVRVSVRRRKGSVEAAAAMQLPTYFFQYLKAGVYRRKGYLYDERGRKYPAMIPFVVRRDQPDKYDELTRVAPDEEAVLTAIAESELFHRLGVSRAQPAVVTI